jgi:hypothetical protein
MGWKDHQLGYRGKMRTLLCALILACMIGCKPGDDANAANNAAEPTAGAAPLETPAGGGGGGVAPIGSGAAAGMTPMAGTESVQGSGGGSTAMAAKELAKSKINNAQSSAAQMPAEDGGN